LNSKKVFLDTNVIIDFIEHSRAKHDIAVRLFEYLSVNSYQICISEDMLSTIFYVAKDKNVVLKFFTVIQKKWDITHYGKETIDTAIDISMKMSLDFEDVLQCVCAKNNNCDTLITNDKYFFDCGIKILSAEDFLSPTIK